MKRIEPSYMRFINYSFDYYYSCILFEWCPAILFLRSAFLAARFFFFFCESCVYVSAGPTGLMFGRLTKDVEIHYPGFRVPLSIERGMCEKYSSISEAVVEVR